MSSSAYAQASSAQLTTTLKETRTWRGYAHRGWLNTNFPIAPDILTVNSSELRIKSMLGNFTFQPGNIVRIERCGFAPFMWSGIMIRHRVPDYPKCIGFRPRGIRPKEILRILQTYGYNVVFPT